jgi:hypothetical protein
MNEYAITKTKNRRVLGTKNEFKFEMRQHSYDKHPETLLLLAAEMAEMPCGAINMKIPIDLVMNLYSKCDQPCAEADLSFSLVSSIVCSSEFRCILRSYPSTANCL